MQGRATEQARSCCEDSLMGKAKFVLMALLVFLVLAVLSWVAGSITALFDLGVI